MKQISPAVLLSILMSTGLSLSHATILAEINFRDKSARLESLQMDVAVPDETNVIGLEKWSDNPAGLAMDEEKSRLAFGFDSDDTTVKTGSNEVKFKTSMPGIYTVLKNDRQAVSGQALFQRQTRTTNDREDTQTAGQIRYNCLLGFMSVGAQAGLLSESSSQTGSSDSDNTTDPMKLGLGLGFKKDLSKGRLLFGVSGHQVSYKLDSAGSRTNTDLNVVSAQTVLQNSERLSMGVMATISHQTDDSLTTENDANQSEIKTRGLWNPFQGVWHLGWELSRSGADSERKSNGLLTRESDQDITGVTLGTSWIAKGKGLLGLELEQTDTDTTTTNHPPLASVTETEIALQYLTLGGEWNVTKSLALRGSLTRLNQTATSNGSETKYKGQMAGLGAGYKFGDQFKLDASFLSLSVDNDTTPGSGDTDEDKFLVLGTLYFQ